MDTMTLPKVVGQTYDCEPTLNDQQVLDFCLKGYMCLEGVVGDAVNQRMMAFIDEHPEHQPLDELPVSAADGRVDLVAQRVLLGRGLHRSPEASDLQSLVATSSSSRLD